MSIFTGAVLANLIAAAINLIFFLIAKNPINLMWVFVSGFAAVIFILLNFKSK